MGERGPVSLLSAVALVHPLGVSTMKSASLPARESGIKRLPDNAARERQPVPARLALLLEQALSQKAVDRILDVGSPSFSQRLEVAVFERPSENGGHCEHFAIGLVEPFDLLFDHLLDGLGQRIARQTHFTRERKRADVVLGDSSRVDERTH